MMQKLNLVVMDREQSWQLRVEQDWAAALIASLSADPDTLLEWQAATGRFLHPRFQQELFRSAVHASATNLQQAVDPPEMPLWSELDGAIDLASRVMWTRWDQATRPLPARYVDVLAADCPELPYDLHPDWQYLQDWDDWQSVTDQRRATRATWQASDPREILYGPPLLQQIVSLTRAQFEDLEPKRQVALCQTEPLVLDSERAADWLVRFGDDASLVDPGLVRAVHSAWLLTPQSCRGARNVRELLLRDQDHLDRDLSDRMVQWSRLGSCPTPLRETDTAYLRGGLGTHEIILYYHFVRKLISAYLVRYAQAYEPPSLSADLAWLSQVRETIWDSECEELIDITPRFAVQQERLRIPLIYPTDKLQHCECPVCRLMGQENSPLMFYGLDAARQDEEFPFSCYASAEGRDDGEPDGRVNDEADLPPGSRTLSSSSFAATRPGAIIGASMWPDASCDGGRLVGHDGEDAFADPGPEVTRDDQIWSSVFNQALPGTSLEIDLFSVAAYTGELIQDVLERTSDREFVVLLNRQVDAFARAMREGNLVDQERVMAAYCDLLDRIELSFPELARKVQDLQHTLVTQVHR